jgi:[ribosomal protein S18]-alanine N-acetyltransferase
MDISYQLRGMVSEDLDAVLELENRCHLHPWTRVIFARELAHDLSAIDLVSVDGQLAGYVVSWSVADEVEIQNIVMGPEWRRMGLAKILLQHVLVRSAGQGGRRALLEVRADNLPAIALYERFGFKINGRRDHYYRDGEAALLMGLDDLSGFASGSTVVDRNLERR